MSLPRLYRLFYRQHVFTFDEARRTLKLRAHSLSKMLYELQRDGYLLRIKKTVYAVVPVGASNQAYIPNKYLVAAKLQKNSYLSYHTALELHGVAESAYNTVYASVRRQARPLQFQGTTYVFLTKIDPFGLINTIVDGIPLSTTDREKTILDGIDRLKYVGGLEAFLKSVSSFPSVDPVKLVRYLKLSKKKALYAKSGWLLSLFAKQWSLNPTILEELKKHLGKRTIYLQETNDKAVSRYNSTWNLMVPVNVESLIGEITS